MNTTDTDVPGWERKELWHKRGKNFLVEVKRHRVEPPADAACFDSEGPHRWNVYAYIYPTHPHFAKFEGPDMWQEAASALPFHGGPSWLRYPMFDGKVTAVHVGCDYHHLHDDFTRYGTPGQAPEVFQDAERLYERLLQLEAS